MTNLDKKNIYEDDFSDDIYVTGEPSLASSGISAIFSLLIAGVVAVGISSVYCLNEAQDIVEPQAISEPSP